MSLRSKSTFVIACVVRLCGMRAIAQPASDDFFEARIRPVLATRCFAWDGEFGRTPVLESGDGRDHHGIDHEKLTYRYAGRDFRLTDVSRNVVRDILL